MKIPFKNIDGFLKSPPQDVAAVLVYGPDEGLVRERLGVLGKHVVQDLNDPFAVVEFTADQLADTPSKLLDEAQSISMLGGRRLIRLRTADDKIAATVKETLKNLKPGDNMILVEAGELGPRSALRLLFEGANNAAALPCYVDDARDIGRVLSDAFRAGGYSISSDALQYMAANVVGDRGVARSEAEKLITYMGTGGKNISLDDVVACVGMSASLPVEDLARHAASGNFAEAQRILAIVLGEGTAAVTILRSLQNHFNRLYITKQRIVRGENTEMAMKKLKPEVFWKMKASFEAQVNGWSIAQIEQAQSVLLSAEAKSKQTGTDPETLCSRAVLFISQLAKSGQRRRA